MKTQETLDVEYYLIKSVAKKGTYGCKEVTLRHTAYDNAIDLPSGTVRHENKARKKQVSLTGRIQVLESIAKSACKQVENYCYLKGEETENEQN